MKVLVVGSGAREHVLCWALAASPLVSTLYCAPGNAGIAKVAMLVDIGLDDFAGIEQFCLAQKVDLVVIGPERPLVRGIVDRLMGRGIRAFGPTAAAARLEGSKSFTKDFCNRHGIPTAGYRVFDLSSASTAFAYVAQHALPVVVKADGLAAGKGVVVAETREQAIDAVSGILDGIFGAAGERVVIEEFLEGEEASLFALCDGRHAIELGTAQDHKRAFDGDRGPNTGGMGAYSPAPVLTTAMTARVMAEIVRPTLAGMAAEGAPFRGFLYAGLMITTTGPKLIEYNVRFGDPECQVILPRLKTDLGQLLLGAMDSVLEHMDASWYPEHALGVVLATRGYPGAFASGSEIRGLDAAMASEALMVFHAATRKEGARWLASGGRVLTVAALGASLVEARDRAYCGVDQIDWPEGFCRRDIGWRVLA